MEKEFDSGSIIFSPVGKKNSLDITESCTLYYFLSVIYKGSIRQSPTQTSATKIRAGPKQKTMGLEVDGRMGDT